MDLEDAADGLDMDSLLFGNDADVLVKTNRKSFSSEVRIAEVGTALSKHDL